MAAKKATKQGKAVTPRTKSFLDVEPPLRDAERLAVIVEDLRAFMTRAN
jgi:hypothetical protein